MIDNDKRTSKEQKNLPEGHSNEVLTIMRNIEKMFERCEVRKKRQAEAAVQMKDLRQRLGVTQSELARKIGVTSSAIWNIENGRAYFSASMMERIVKAYPGIELKEGI